MNLIYLTISLIFSTSVSFFTIKNFSNSSATKKSFLIYFLIMLPLFLIINLYFQDLIKLLAIVILTTLSLYFSLFNRSIGNSLYYTIVYEIFVFIIEIILSIVFVSLTNLNLNENYPLLTLIFSIIDSLLIYLISRIKFINKIILKINKIVSKKQYEFFYMIIIMLLIGIMLVYNGYNFKKDLSFYINASMIIFVFITFLYIIYRNIQNEKLETNYNEMMDYVQKYEKIINEQGKKNHEYNNQLMVIKGYSHNPKKLEEYLDLIINEHKCGQNYTIRELSYFPDGGIKGLIYHKISKMEENNIKYFLFIDKNIKDIFEEKFDLKTYQDITKLLGVFLDNAIEATMLSDKKEVEIDFKKQDDCIIMDISNTFNNKNDIKQIGKKGFTTKGFGHGYGLSIVKDINKHNNNIETFNDIEDDKFKQTTIIYFK